MRLIAFAALCSLTASLLAESTTSTIAFQSSATSVVSTAGTIQLTVLRTGDLSSQSVASVVATPGTANNGSDYTLSNGTITFPPSSSVATVQLSIVNNLTATYPLTFSVMITSTDPLTSIGSPSTETVSIVGGGTTGTGGSSTTGTTTGSTTGATGSTTGSTSKTSKGCGHGGLAPAMAGVAALIALRLTGRRRR